MSDDKRPPSQNPFIRFKQHVDARIGTGISVITGGARTNTNTSGSQEAQAQAQPAQQQEQFYSSARVCPPTATTNTTTTTTMSQNPPSGGESFPAYTSTSYWNDWAQLSPYSPYNLRHLRQPVPSDLPADMVNDAHLFGFEDAFEDLLASTRPVPGGARYPLNSAGYPAAYSSLPLLDLRRHALYKRHVRSAFPAGEPPMLWVNRLKDSGLLPLPFPAATVQQRSSALAGGGGQLASQTGLSVPKEAVDALRRPEEERRRAAEAAMPDFEQGSPSVEELIKDIVGRIAFDPAGVFTKTLKVVEDMMEKMEEELKANGKPADPSELLQRIRQKSRELAQDPSKRQPSQNNEDDQVLEAFLAAMGVNETSGERQDREQEEDSWLQSFLAETGVTETAHEKRRAKRQPRQDDDDDVDSWLESFLAEMGIAETPRERRRRREQEQKRRQPQLLREGEDPHDDLWLELLASMGITDNPKNSAEEQAKKTAARQQPDVEEDLYSAFDSALDKVDASIGAWARVLLDTFRGTAPWPEASRAPRKQTEEAGPVEVVEHDGSGGKTVRSTTEHVDMFGYVHQKAETRRLDASGRQVSCETRYSVRPGPGKDKSAAEKVEQEVGVPVPAAQVAKERKNPAAATEVKPSGWFWR